MERMGKSVIPADSKLMKKNDVILVAAFLALALAALGGVFAYSALTTKAPEAVVYLDGEEWGRYPLSKDAVVEICPKDGQYNILQIREGRADITEASCPDKICVRHRPVKMQGESLVCLPNRVVVEIENGAEMGVDAGTR